MTKTTATLASIFLLLSCTIAAHGASYPTVSFVETDKTGLKVRELELALTDSPARTCIAGDWKEAKIISDKHHYTKTPAYTWNKGRLEVLLINTVCDSYNSYVGSLSGSVFKGKHVAYGLGFSKNLGNVSGTYSKP